MPEHTADICLYNNEIDVELFKYLSVSHVYVLSILQYIFIVFFLYVENELLRADSALNTFR